jgi:hypothetical protein
MPEMSFFLDEHDVPLLLHRLNADSEIAFVVPDGQTTPTAGEDSLVAVNLASPQPYISMLVADRIAGIAPASPVPQRWKAVHTVESLEDGHHSLWHVPAGPLPLIPVHPPEVHRRPYPPIPNPWAGWTGHGQFGPGCHPWIRLEIETRHRPYTQQERATPSLLRSSWWMEDHDLLAVSGFQWTGGHFSPAPKQTLRWWSRMKGWVERTAVRLHTNPAFWAFPSALRKLKDGMEYYSRNYNLDEGIRAAEVPRSK